jgi:predicted RNA-binding Zn-ribbon protein involved in translation (DUF1610 family)
MPQIRETKCECKACGNVWFYGKQEEWVNAGSQLHNIGKEMMCCTGCAPATLIPDQKVTDFDKCPKCGSRAITKSIVVHNV